MYEYLQKLASNQEKLLFDGAMGTMIQKEGKSVPGVSSDLLCIEDPDLIIRIQSAYCQAGAQVITTNTFNSNALALQGRACVIEVYTAAVNCARTAGARFVAGDMGPLGVMLEPFGDVEPEEAYDLFFEQADAAAKAGADLILIETMSDTAELREAVRAAKDACKLPIFATMSFGEGGRTYFGVSPTDAAILLEELGVHALGANCSTGPKEMIPLIAELASCTKLPIIAQPNAGLPQMIEGKVVYDVSPEDFASAARELLDAGASIVGGCCGTEPQHIAALHALL